MRTTKAELNAIANRVSKASGLTIKINRANGITTAVIVFPSTGQVTIGAGTPREVYCQLRTAELTLWYKEHESNVH